MKKILSLLFASASLVACSNGYNGPKVSIPFVEDGKLVTLSGQQLYETVVTNSENSIVLFGVDNCASCALAVDDMSAFAEMKKCNVYYVNITHMDIEEYNYVVNATTAVDSLYAFPSYGEEVSLPKLYIFMDKGVALTFSTNFVDNLLQYTEIKNA